MRLEKYLKNLPIYHLLTIEKNTRYNADIIVFIFFNRF